MKKVLVCFLSLTMLMSLGGCSAEKTASGPSGSTVVSSGDTAGNPGGGDTKAKIGACVMSLSYDFQLKMCNGIERAAAENGYESMIYDFNADTELMLSGLEMMADNNVKALYGLFTAPEAATDFMRGHEDIGVLMQGQNIDGCRARTVNDYKKLGEQFVDALEYYVTDNGITDGGIAALWLDSCANKDSDYYTAKQVIEQTITEWCEGKEYYYAPSEYYPTDEENAANITTQILNADPNIKFFFCFNNSYGISASNEIAAAAPDSSIYFVFASEGDDEVFRLIADENSPLRACAYANVEESGYLVGMQLINWVENGKMENVAVYKELVDSRNIAEYIK